VKRKIRTSDNRAEAMVRLIAISKKLEMPMLCRVCKLVYIFLANTPILGAGVA